jgi:sulfite exporter TauE/SafE
MFALGMAVVVASLLGSLHCVGMCGPLAIWATSEGTKPVTLVAYHLGRLTTYLSAGLMAGLLGSALTIGGDFAGLQSLAAMIAGGFLVLLGLIRIARMLPAFRRPLVGVPIPIPLPKPSRIAGWLHHAKPLLASRGPLGRSYLAGLFTTWLPCGWLYLFVLIAAGTGSVIPALAVMFAFWIGTLPALTGLVLGAGSLMKRSTTIMPIAASLLLIATGLYTATGRASADLTSIVSPQTSKVDQTSNVQDPMSLISLQDEPLPCCQESE